MVMYLKDVGWMVNRVDTGCSGLRLSVQVLRVNTVPDYLFLELTLLLLNMTCPVLANSVDPDQLASEEAN